MFNICCRFLLIMFQVQSHIERYVVLYSNRTREKQFKLRNDILVVKVVSPPSLQISSLTCSITELFGANVDSFIRTFKVTMSECWCPLHILKFKWTKPRSKGSDWRISRMLSKEPSFFYWAREKPVKKKEVSLQLIIW